MELKTRYKANGLPLGVVVLFTGCLGRYLEQNTIRDAIRLLTRLGYTVHVPDDQQCCGAMHLHSGDMVTARRLARYNAEVFNQFRPDAVLYLSSGCGAMLQEYGQTALAAKIDCPAMDISQFLNRVNWPHDLALSPSARTITLHSPCTQRNVTGSGRDTLQLCQRIPELTIREPAANTGCCGAAGSYMLSEADMAIRIRENTLQQLARLETTTLVTSNIGCALFLAAGMREAGKPVEVLHPVSLIARQLLEERE